MGMKVLSKSVEDTRKIAEKILKMLPKKEDEATVIFIYGDLGVGKTEFVKQIALLLNIEEEITSPTFPILKSYEIPDGKFYELIHIDAYRIEDESEFGAIKIEKYLKNSDNLVIVEWPELLEERYGGEYLGIKIVDKGGAREFSIDECSQ